MKFYSINHGELTNCLCHNTLTATVTDDSEKFRTSPFISTNQRGRVEWHRTGHTSAALQLCSSWTELQKLNTDRSGENAESKSNLFYYHKACNCMQIMQNRWWLICQSVDILKSMPVITHFKSSPKPIQIGLCMLTSLSIHLHGLRLDASMVRHDICRHNHIVERGP